jgi:hypothetical protein
MTEAARQRGSTVDKSTPKQELDSGRTFCKYRGNPHKTAPPSALTPSEAKEHGAMHTALPCRTLEERLDAVKTTADFHSQEGKLTEAEVHFLDFLVDLAVKSCS